MRRISIPGPLSPSSLRQSSAERGAVELNEITQRLLADGMPLASIVDAVELLQTGAADLITQVISGKITVKVALETARRRGRR